MKARKAMKSMKAMKSSLKGPKPTRKSQAETSDEDDDDESMEDEHESEEPTGEHQTSGARAAKNWALAVSRGEKPKKPTEASVWVTNRLKQLDNEQGSTQNLERYKQAAGTKAKSRIALKLALDMPGYCKDTHAYSNSYRSDIKSMKTKSGWMTWWEVADDQKIPASLPDEERKELTMELITGKRAKERMHENAKWAAKGIQQFWWTSGGLAVEYNARAKSVGTSKLAAIDEAHMKSQSAMVEAELDGDFDDACGSDITPSAALPEPKKSKDQKLAEKEQKSQDLF